MKNWEDTYDYVGSFSDGRACVELNNKYGFVDVDGNEVIPLKYDDAGYFYEGRVCVKLNEKCGFVDTEGNVVIPLKYDDVDEFSEERARVRHNEKYGFVDTEGNEVVPLKYDWVDSFYEGRAVIHLIINGERIEGEVDLDGKEYFKLEDLPKLRKYRLPNILDSIS
jgi:hypothetical protein